MSGREESPSASHIMPRDKGAAPLDFVIAVMALLAALALGASLIASRAAEGWQQGLSDRMTVQVLPPEEGDAAAGLRRETRAALAVLNVSSAQELAEVIAAVGLAQNLAALRALASEGIQRGHMALHARNIAIVAGATGPEVDQVARELAAAHDVRADRAREILARIRQ